MFKFREKSAFLLVLFIFVLHILYVFYVPTTFSLRGDADTYDTLAYNLSRGNGFSIDVNPPYQPFIRRPPLYPLFLSLIYFIFGHNILVAKVIQALLVSAACFFIFLISRELFSSKIGITSLLLAGVYPAFFAYSGMLVTETLAIFLFVLLTYFFIKTLRKKKVIYCILTGFFLGLSSLCRSEMLYFTIFIFVGFLVSQGNKLKAIVTFCIVVLVTIFTILPWSIRNYRVTGKIIPIHAEGGAFWIATYPHLILEDDTNKRHTNPEFLALEKYVQENKLSTAERSTLLRRKALKNLRKYPSAFFKNSVKRFFIFWVGGHSYIFPGLEDSFSMSLKNKCYPIAFTKILLLFYNTAIIIFAIIGILSQLKNWKLLFPLLSIIFYKTLLHTFTITGSRYAIPIMPFILIFSAVGFYQLKCAFLNREQSKNYTC